MKKTGIYKITCLVTGLVYVGYSIDLCRREKDHECSYIGKNVDKAKIKESIKKYGWVNHEFEILEECSISLLKDKEKEYIEKYNSCLEGLNLNFGGGGPIHHTQETKDKISKARKGWIPSNERGIKIGAKNRNRRLTQETKDKISQSNKKPKPCLKGRISPNKGNFYNMTEGQKAKMRNSHGVKIKQYDMQNNFIKEFQIIEEASRMLNIRSRDISACINGKQKKAGGFIWKRS